MIYYSTSYSIIPPVVLASQQKFVYFPRAWNARLGESWQKSSRPRTHSSGQPISCLGQTSCKAPVCPCFAMEYQLSVVSSSFIAVLFQIIARNEAHLFLRQVRSECRKTSFKSKTVQKRERKVFARLFQKAADSKGRAFGRPSQWAEPSFSRPGREQKEKSGSADPPRMTPRRHFACKMTG